MIDKTIILGLDRRKELWQSLFDDCIERGFDTEIFVVGDGSDPSLNYRYIDRSDIPQTWQWGQGLSALRHCNAFFSHKSIIKYAMKNDYNNIMLLEDDTYFIEPRFSQFWPELLEGLSCMDFDIIRLGWHAYEYKNHKMSGENLVIEENFHKNGKSWLQPIWPCGGLWAVIINKSLYKTILNMPAVAPIDHQLNGMRNQIYSFNVIPNMMWVKSCYSSCEDMFVVRDEL